MPVICVLKLRNERESTSQAFFTTADAKLTGRLNHNKQGQHHCHAWKISVFVSAKVMSFVGPGILGNSLPNRYATLH